MDDVDTHGLDLLQPTLLPGENKKEVHALCRSRHGYIFALKSTDEGKTWSEPQQTALKNPNSACEAIVLANGQSLLAFNNSSDRRYPLNVAVADSPPDFGEAIVIEDELGSYEYPSVCQSPDGLIHITYTWNKRQIAHTTLEVS